MDKRKNQDEYVTCNVCNSIHMKLVMRAYSPITSVYRCLMCTAETRTDGIINMFLHPDAGNMFKEHKSDLCTSVNVFHA